MSEKNNETLKPGWRRVKFGDVVRQCKEKADPETSGLERYIAGDHMDTDDLRLRRWGEIGSGYLGPAFHIRFKPGQVLYGSRRTYLRKVAVADFDGICANTTFVLESKNPDVLLPELLPFIMQTDPFNEFSIKNSKGSVNPYINFSDLERFEFSVPPLDEQWRILEIMSAAEELSEKLRQADIALHLLRASLAVERFSEVDSCKLVSCAELISRGSLSLQTGPFGTVLKASSYRDKGIPIVNPVNMKDGRLEVDDGPFVGLEDWQRLEKYWMRPGDMLIGRKGDMSNLIYVLHEYDKYLIGSDTIRFRVNPAEIIPRYFFHFLRSEVTQNWIQGQAYGTVMPGINEKILGRLKVHVPSSAEQEAIANEFDAIETARTELKQRLTEAKSIKKKALSDAFLREQNVH